MIIAIITESRSLMSPITLFLLIIFILMVFAILYIIYTLILKVINKRVDRNSSKECGRCCKKCKDYDTCVKRINHICEDPFDDNF